MSQQEYPKMSFTDFRMFVNLTTWACHILSVGVSVFFHIAPGERFVGLPGLLVVPLLIIYGAFTQPYGGGVLLALVPVYIVMCSIWHLWAVYRRVRLRRLVHTRYAGRPWLCFVLPWLSEMVIRRLEPVLVGVAGAVIATVNHPVGFFLLMAAVGQAMSMSIQRLVALGRELDEADNMLEQKERAARSRQLSGL